MAHDSDLRYVPPRPLRVRRACGHWEIICVAPPDAYVQAVAATVRCHRCLPPRVNRRPAHGTAARSRGGKKLGTGPVRAGSTHRSIGEAGDASVGVGDAPMTDRSSPLTDEQRL